MSKGLMMIAVCVTCATYLVPTAMAQRVVTGSGYPVRPIRVVVPSQAGGGADIVARAIAQKMSEALGNQMVVDNRIGIVGAEIVAKSAPDGYTLMFTTSALAVREAVYANLPFNTLRDFQPVSQAVTQSNVLVTHPAVAAKNVQELVALAKGRPGQLNYGSGGNGSSSHLAFELFRLLTGVDVVHVPYKGVPAALGDTIAGRMHLTIGSPVSTLHHVKDGRLKLLAVTTPKRAPALPEVPTMAESGVPGYEFTGWMGLLAPMATPRPIIVTLHREVARIVHLPDVKQRFVIDAADPVGNTPEQFAAHLKAEIERWQKVARQARLKIE